MTAAASPPAIATPCIGVCRMHHDGLCLGCRRTLAEIANWGRLPETERRRIMASLPSRPAPRQVVAG